MARKQGQVPLYYFHLTMGARISTVSPNPRDGADPLGLRAVLQAPVFQSAPGPVQPERGYVESFGVSAVAPGGPFEHTAASELPGFPQGPAPAAAPAGFRPGGDGATLGNPFGQPTAPLGAHPVNGGFEPASPFTSPPVQSGGGFPHFAAPATPPAPVSAPGAAGHAAGGFHLGAQRPVPNRGMSVQAG